MPLRIGLKRAPQGQGVSFFQVIASIYKNRELTKLYICTSSRINVYKDLYVYSYVIINRYFAFINIKSGFLKYV